MGVLGLTSTTALVEVASSPQNITLSIGREELVELTGDDYYDLKILLNSLSATHANITLSYVRESIAPQTPIAEEIAEEIPVVEEPSAPEPIEQITAPEPESDSSKKQTLAVLAAALVIALALFTTFRRKK